ncbi:non-ribosomal peptide synthetase, partial [Planktothrix sp. FACHB-1355]|uniref:condensation domain-containing protein n=1 Tax=Planktothrix sp. FACHB-1355 TaxID=2692854 RepID=UPI0019CB4B27
MKNGNIEAVYPLSPMQQGMFFHSQLAPESGVYIEQLNCEMEGDLSTRNFIAACQQIVDRHSILRTAFAGASQDKLLQVVGKKVKLPFEILDWTGKDEETQKNDLTELQKADRENPFELGRAPLMRVKIIRLGGARHHLIWTHHHLLLDGWSVPILLREVFLCYESFCRGDGVPSLPAA